MIERMIPPNTPPVTPSSVMIAQFSPCEAGALGSPKQVEQAKIRSGMSSTKEKTIKVFVKYLIFLYLF